MAETETLGQLEEELSLLKEEHERLKGKYDALKENYNERYDQIKDLEDENEKLEEQLAIYKSDYTRLQEKNSESEKEISNLNLQIKKLEDEFASREEKLKESQDDLEEQRAMLLELQEELEEEREELSNLKASFSIDESINNKVEIERLNARNEILIQSIRTLEQEKLEFKNKLDDAETILFKNQYLEKELEKQSEIIKTYRQSEIQWERIQQLQENYEEIERQAQYAKLENSRLHAELKQLREEVTKYKQDSERLQAAEHRSAFYEIRTRNLEREIQRYRKKEQEAIADESRVFESFQVLIENHQKTEDTVVKYPGDGVIVNRILDVATEGGFEFSNDMIQGFLAAMRSTKFIILKGLSGTGKTSLPKIVAKALGGVCETIAVQPNWKSKTDLIGFYNHFNDRFMATQFTEELFKAQLPENRNKFYFIVLDEMNLARVEYYFSDFNSKLELEQSKQVIELFDTIGRTTGTLSEYIKEGNKLQIPSNVFFIGTINEDDTTHTISDKIYDRAQVLDFQSALSNRVGNMEKVNDISMPPVSFYNFRDENEQLQKEDVAKLLKPIDQILDVLKNKVFLEIGNRPRRHIRSFLQTYKKNDWDASHGVDLQIVSKIVPKIMPSYDEEFTVAMDEIIAIANRNRKESITSKAIEKVKRNAR